jgi:hypothetical protein
MEYQIKVRDNGKWYLDPPVKLDLEWKERLIQDKADYWNVPYWQMKLIIERKFYPVFVDLCIKWSKSKLLKETK